MGNMEPNNGTYSQGVLLNVIRNELANNYNVPTLATSSTRSRRTCPRRKTATTATPTAPPPSGPTTKWRNLSSILINLSSTSATTPSPEEDHHDPLHAMDLFHLSRHGHDLRLQDPRLLLPRRQGRKDRLQPRRGLYLSSKGCALPHNKISHRGVQSNL